MNATYWSLPIAAYFYGSIPFGFLMAKRLRGVDIRETGSGSIGATNAARALGFRWFPVVFLLDLSKGLAPALVAALLAAGRGEFRPHPLVVAAPVAAILGHVFPIFLRFKGGKAVAAGAGACAIIAPWALLAAAAVWGIVFAVWRYVSLASICAAASLGTAVWVVYCEPLDAGLFRTGFCTLAALFVIALHRANIRRLLSGTEHRIGAGPPPAQPEGDGTGETVE